MAQVALVNLFNLISFCNIEKKIKAKNKMSLLKFVILNLMVCMALVGRVKTANCGTTLTCYNNAICLFNQDTQAFSCVCVNNYVGPECTSRKLRSNHYRIPYIYVQLLLSYKSLS